MARGITSCNSCREAFDSVWEARWSRNPLDPRNFISSTKAIRQLQARNQYDLVHVHTPVASFVTRFALRSVRPRPMVVYTAHGFHFFRGNSKVSNLIFSSAEGLASRWTDAIVVINREDQQAADKWRERLRGGVRYMPGIGVDPSLYGVAAVPPDTRERNRREWGIPTSDTVFLMVAEFIPRKRHEDAIRAFHLLGDSRAHLLLAGAGPLWKPMQRLVRSLGIHERVRFLGVRDGIPALFRSSDASLLPSRQEGLPRAVMESLSLQVPVIGANTRGTRDLLSSGGGWLVEAGDVQGLASLMRWVMDHPEQARAMGRKGAEQMRSYELSRIVAMHEELYQDLTGLALQNSRFEVTGA
jgi:glycosyltransferase involved in cell wall biosynthesis